VDARCLVGIQCIFHVTFYHNYVICAGVEFHLVYEGITGESMTTVLPFYSILTVLVCTIVLSGRYKEIV